MVTEKGTETGLKEAPKAVAERTNLSCDCLQRCQSKSLRISNEITRNDCSQGFPNEIDARPRSQALRKLLLLLLQVLAVCSEHWQGLWP